METNIRTEGMTQPRPQTLSGPSFPLSSLSMLSLSFFPPHLSPLLLSSCRIHSLRPAVYTVAEPHDRQLWTHPSLLLHARIGSRHAHQPAHLETPGKASGWLGLVRNPGPDQLCSWGRGIKGTAHPEPPVHYWALGSGKDTRGLGSLTYLHILT